MIKVLFVLSICITISCKTTDNSDTKTDRQASFNGLQMSCDQQKSFLQIIQNQKANADEVYKQALESKIIITGEEQQIWEEGVHLEFVSKITEKYPDENKCLFVEFDSSSQSKLDQLQEQFKKGAKLKYNVLGNVFYKIDPIGLSIIHGNVVVDAIKNNWSVFAIDATEDQCPWTDEYQNNPLSFKNWVVCKNKIIAKNMLQAKMHAHCDRSYAINGWLQLQEDDPFNIRVKPKLERENTLQGLIGNSMGSRPYLISLAQTKPLDPKMHFFNFSCPHTLKKSFWYRQSAGLAIDHSIKSYWDYWWNSFDAVYWHLTI